MKNDKVWDKIDASPLLQLPPEQRKALHEAGDEQFRTLWGDCFAAALTLGQPVDGGDFCRIFLKAFDFWVPKPGQTFSAYLRSALKHQNAHDAQQEQMAVTGFGRETNRKIKNALAYMAKNQITEEKLCHDPEKEQLVADIAGVGVKTLREAQGRGQDPAGGAAQQAVDPQLGRHRRRGDGTGNAGRRPCAKRGGAGRADR